MPTSAASAASFLELDTVCRSLINVPADDVRAMFLALPADQQRQILRLIQMLHASVSSAGWSEATPDPRQRH